MKKISIVCHRTEETADKFRKSMNGLIDRLHCPASVEITETGAIILADTNEVTLCKIKVRAEAIARRCGETEKSQNCRVAKIKHEARSLMSTAHLALTDLQNLCHREACIPQDFAMELNKLMRKTAKMQYMV